MRTASDRFRHAISFEVIALVVSTPLGAWVFGLPLHDMGAVTLISASIAAAWNYGYNIAFDHSVLRLRGSTAKTVPLRLVHAVLFEVGLMALLVPFIVVWLDVSPGVALTLDAAFSLFYVAYAFAFNWGYDVVFPVAPIHRKP